MDALYIHIPFCARRCVYCSFYTEALGRGTGRDPRVGVYLEALDLELSRLTDDYAPHTVFMGGGTPNALSADELRRLFALLHHRVDLSQVTEWTVEANPGLLTPERIVAIAEGGVNRVSLGAQSFQPHLLSFLTRDHGPEAVGEAVRRLREAGFENLSLDLMTGLPEQSIEGLDRDIDHLLDLAPDHCSAYCLEVHPGTPLARRVESGQVQEAAPDIQAAHYERLLGRLEAAGLAPYELSNFARPGRECLHNRMYWVGAEFAGVGPGAHSYRDGVRFHNPRNLEAWADALRDGRDPATGHDRIDAEARAREILVMWLRLDEGVPRNAFRERTGFDLDTLGGRPLREQIGQGWIENRPDRIRLAPRARFVSNAVFAELV